MRKERFGKLGDRKCCAAQIHGREKEDYSHLNHSSTGNHKLKIKKELSDEKKEVNGEKRNHPVLVQGGLGKHPSMPSYYPESTSAAAALKPRRKDTDVLRRHTSVWSQTHVK